MAREASLGNMPAISAEGKTQRQGRLHINRPPVAPEPNTSAKGCSRAIGRIAAPKAAQASCRTGRAACRDHQALTSSSAIPRAGKSAANPGTQGRWDAPGAGGGSIARRRRDRDNSTRSAAAFGLGVFMRGHLSKHGPIRSKLFSQVCERLPARTAEGKTRERPCDRRRRDNGQNPPQPVARRRHDGPQHQRDAAQHSTHAHQNKCDHAQHRATFQSREGCACLLVKQTDVRLQVVDDQLGMRGHEPQQGLQRHDAARSKELGSTVDPQRRSPDRLSSVSNAIKAAPVAAAISIALRGSSLIRPVVASES